MSLYKKYQEAWDGQDIGAMLELYHPEYNRVFHATGIEQGLDDLEPMMSLMGYEPEVIGLPRII